MERETVSVMEIFTSLQGEGPELGARHLFVRFYGCNRRCVYCDTEAALKLSGPCRIEQTPGRGDFRERPNPLNLEEVAHLILSGSVQAGGIDALTLTGGEPLLYAPFLRELLPLLDHRFPCLLETNGLLSDALQSVLPWIDVVSMDVKIPSATGEAADWEGHRRFLQTGGAKIGYVKTVLSPDVKEDELHLLAELIRSGGCPPLVLQPVSGSERDRSWIERLFDIQAGLREAGIDSVRIIPQVHKLLGVL
ncbi:MAG: 7-carboxy-7-deazaguanine synthase QueE [Deltaproteobacteria bacterium]|nr:7-carboxy-7-deazaguanine synthase QueE [Deltaproteobacteria bacterium]